MSHESRTERPGPKPDAAHADTHGDAAVRDVRDILDGRQEVILVHAGEKYRLRITSKGKLILTK